MFLSPREDTFLPKLVLSMKLLKQKVLTEHDYLPLACLIILAPTIQVQLYVPGTVTIKKKKIVLSKVSKYPLRSSINPSRETVV